MRFADDVLLFASSEEQLQKCCANSRKVLKKWDSGCIQKRRIFSAIKTAQARTQKKEIEVDDMKVEILTSGENVRYLGQDDYFPSTGDDRKQEIGSGLRGRRFTSTGRS